MNVIAGTGHRPPRLSLGYEEADARLLTEFAIAMLRDRPADRVISGGAQGWDQSLAEAAIALRIPLLLAVPFKGQEANWPPDAQARYREIYAAAEYVATVCDVGYARWKFIKRDEWMVDRATGVLALLDDKPQKSGTRTTVEYAGKKGVPVENVWAEWEAFRDGWLTDQGGTT